MATVKITDLTSYTDPKSTDVLPIVDVTVDVTKKVDIATVLKNAALGSPSSPAFAFDTDPNTGIYSPGTDMVGVVTNGVERLRVDSNGQVEAASLGSAANPTFTFMTDMDSGVYSSGDNQVSIATNGIERFRVDANGQLHGVFLGTAATPAFSFTTDTNTGIYSPGADQLSIATNGTERLRVKASGVFRAVSPLTVATLTGGEVGDIARVTDANNPTIGSTVAGGGSANALVWFNGTNWTVIGK